MRRALLAVLGMAALATPIGAQKVPGAGTAPAALEALSKDYRQARRAYLEKRDFTPAAVSAQQGVLKAFRGRLDALPRAGWPIADQVDAMVVRVEMNQEDFDLRVLRPASRNPNFYVQQTTGGLPDPAKLTVEQAARAAARLEGVPALLDQARTNLTDVSRDHALIALRYIEQPAGVRNQASAVDQLNRYAAAAQAAQPAVAAAATKAAASLTGYGKWLRGRLETFKAPGNVGLDNFDWYLRNVLLMPYTAKELLALAERDYQRSMANLAFEENRNRKLPPLKPAATESDYAAIVKQADDLVRKWLVDANIISIPDDVGPMGATVPWKEGGEPGQQTPIHYWQEIQFRDPLPDHVHAGIPGHKYDGIVSRRHPRPIRAGFSSQGRTEGWGFYLEEMTLQSGLLDQRPRTRELFFNFQLFRYLRMIVDIKMAAGDMTVTDAVSYQEKYVPFMEEQVAWIDATSYFLRPTAGSTYTAGKYQMEALVARLRHELGDKFDLKLFHDRFMQAGSIPISLIDWEMTGDDSSIKRLGLTN